jgi:hypothetical protein
MRLAMLLVVLLVPAVEAQVLPPIRVPLVSRLDQYLEITPEQSRRFNENQAEFTRWTLDKIRRMAQVRAEIVQETAQPQPDAFAIGIRYVEIEAICRQGREQLAELRRKNLGILTTAQRAKLEVLNEALKLLPLITEAQERYLLPGTGLSPLGQIGGIGGLLPGFGRNPLALTGCESFPGNIIPLPIFTQAQPAESSR